MGRMRRERAVGTGWSITRSIKEKWTFVSTAFLRAGNVDLVFHVYDCGDE